MPDETTSEPIVLPPIEPVAETPASVPASTTQVPLVLADDSSLISTIPVTPASATTTDHFTTLTTVEESAQTPGTASTPATITPNAIPTIESTQSSAPILQRDPIPRETMSHTSVIFDPHSPDEINYLKTVFTHRLLNLSCYFNAPIYISTSYYYRRR